MERLEQLMICGLVGFAVSLGISVAIIRASRRQLSSRLADFHHTRSTDSPDQMPVPRFGGVALAAAFAILVCLPSNFLFGFQFDPMRWVIASMALAMFGLGFWDDVRRLGAKRKLAGQLVIASAAYFLGLGIHQFKIPLADRILDLGFYGWPVTVFWLVAMTNLINLIDGVDGLAGGIAFMLMLLLTAVGSGMDLVSVLAAGMAGALVAFLRFNFPPAKIYLGDGGAYFLGFLIGCLTIYNSHKGTVVAALIAPLFVLALPILDTSFAMLRRGLNGLPLFRPDRRHLHHRILQSGVSRRNLALGAYMFTAYFLGLGLVAFWWRGQHFALLLGSAAVAVLLMAGQFSFSREWFNVGKVLGNSLNARAEIHYALTQSRWLGMEGARGRTIRSICDDTALVARKLGFARVRIRLENGEEVWKWTNCAAGGQCAKQTESEGDSNWMLVGAGACRCHVFRQSLPGHPASFLELQTPMLEAQTDQGQPTPPARPRITCPSKYEIVSDLVAEGWGKSLIHWHKLNKLPIRFNPPDHTKPVHADLVPPLPALAENVTDANTGKAR